MGQGPRIARRAHVEIASVESLCFSLGRSSVRAVPSVRPFVRLKNAAFPISLPEKRKKRKSKKQKEDPSVILPHNAMQRSLYRIIKLLWWVGGL